MKKRLVSIVSPAYNEEECVDELCRRLGIVAAALADRYDFEFVIIENGSMDGTFERLQAIQALDDRVKIVRFSRNFGAEGAVTAGLRYASGDAAVIMSADLQDPPELVPEFIEHWEKGYDNVYGIIERRTDEGALRQTLTRVFYKMLNRLNTHPVPENVSDFRLVSRAVYATLNSMPERNRMLRAMWGWIGFKSIGIAYTRPPRFGGRSTYALWRNVGFALHGLLASSVVPLKVIPLFGFSVSALSFFLLIVSAIRWVAFGVPFQGYGTIVALLLGLFGVLFLFLGIMSEYIGMIFDEVRERPAFVVADVIGFGTKSPVPTFPVAGEEDDTQQLITLR